jgi:hypothetical protein
MNGLLQSLFHVPLSRVSIATGGEDREIDTTEFMAALLPDALGRQVYNRSSKVESSSLSSLFSPGTQFRGLVSPLRL